MKSPRVIRLPANDALYTVTMHRITRHPSSLCINAVAVVFTYFRFLNTLSKKKKGGEKEIVMCYFIFERVTVRSRTYFWKLFDSNHDCQSSVVWCSYEVDRQRMWNQMAIQLRILIAKSGSECTKSSCKRRHFFNFIVSQTAFRKKWEQTNVWMSFEHTFASIPSSSL